MQLKQIFLQNFRNYGQKEFALTAGTTLVVGPNAAGKTNLLEAVYLLATGKSFRAGLESEMIGYGAEIGRVGGEIKGEEKTDLEIVLTRGEVAGEKVARKKYLVNGVAKRALDFVGHLRAVYFRPEDLELVTDSPSLRRKYLDAVLIQADREYLRCLMSYEKGLRQRNKLLERIRDEGAPRSQLLFWDQLLIKNGEYLTAKREEFINFCNTRYEIRDTSDVSRLTSHGLPSYWLEYARSIISPARLEEYANEEVIAAATLVGPHRDDFSFEIRDTKNVRRNLHAFGSRGEQRLAILWLKLAELEFIAQATDSRPVLLLDDIFSELDEGHRHLVLEVIPHQQTIITTTDITQIDPEFRQKLEVIKL